MFKSKGIGMSKVRRLAAIVLVGSLSLIVTTAPVSAQTLSGGGKIYAVADCHLATNTAYVAVTAMNPAKFKTTGLIYYTQLWAKARFESNYNFITYKQSPAIKTWSTRNGVSINNPKRIFSGTFTGSVEALYDIYIQYWYRTPTGSIWAGPYGFAVAGDRDSHISITSYDGFGNLTSPASDCQL